MDSFQISWVTGFQETYNVYDCIVVDWQGMDTHTVVMVMDTAMDTPMTILMDTHTWMVDITILMIQVCVW